MSYWSGVDSPKSKYNYRNNNKVVAEEPVRRRIGCDMDCKNCSYRSGGKCTNNNKREGVWL